MQSRVVYVLYGVMVSVVCLGLAGSSATLDVSGQSSEPNVNATISKVIDAMLADGQEGDGGIPIPEHHHDKAQRIVARKGVINDGDPGLARPVVPSLNVPSTSQSANIVAADEKPNVTSTELPAAGGKPVATKHATSSSTSSSSVPVKATGSHSVQNPISQLVLGNVTATANATTVTTSAASSSSTSALSAASSTLKPPQSKPSTTQRASTATSSTTTTTTASTTTTTTTTTVSSTTSSTTAKPPPKKPTITYSVEDEPKLLQAAKPGYATPSDPMDSSGRLRVDEPLAQFSKEFIPSQLGGRDAPNSRREYVVPIVTLIFAIPLLLGLFLLSYRRAKEFWLTRHYRRMDFLIDGMYNY